MTSARRRRAQAGSSAAGRTSPCSSAGAVLLVLAALPVHRDSVARPEAAVFRALNGTTVLPFVVVWPVMQLGNVLVVPASAAGRGGLPPVVAGRASCCVAGAGTYLLAKVVKGLGAARPAAAGCCPTS